VLIPASKVVFYWQESNLLVLYCNKIWLLSTWGRAISIH